MTESEAWAIPRRVWFVLMSWGLAVLLLAGLFSYWTYRNDEAQDRNLCRLTTALISSNEPTGSSPGEIRSRENRAAIREWQAGARCSRFN